MAGIYSNTIKDLIKQSRINLKLLNEVNRAFDELDNLDNHKTLSDLIEIHKRNYNKEYRHKSTPYLYFDGTNFINCLLSMIVIPCEFLKVIPNIRDNLLRDSNWDSYYNCVNLINKLKNEGKYVCYYQDELNKPINLYKFIKHLRNSIAHSGCGRIQFLSSNGKDIDEILFFDCNDNKNQTQTRKAIFKIDEIILFVEEFSKIIINISETYSINVTIEDIENMIDESRKIYEK